MYGYALVIGIFNFFSINHSPDYFYLGNACAIHITILKSKKNMNCLRMPEVELYHRKLNAGSVVG